MPLVILDAALVLLPCAFVAWRYHGDARRLAAIVAAVFLSHQAWYYMAAGAESLMLGCLGDGLAVTYTLSVSRSKTARAVAALFVPAVASYAAVMLGVLDYAVMAAWVASLLTLQAVIIAGSGFHGARHGLETRIDRGGAGRAAALVRDPHGSQGQ